MPGRSKKRFNKAFVCVDCHKSFTVIVKKCGGTKRKLCGSHRNGTGCAYQRFLAKCTRYNRKVGSPKKKSTKTKFSMSERAGYYGYNADYRRFIFWNTFILNNRPDQLIEALNKDEIILLTEKLVNNGKSLYR